MQIWAIQLPAEPYIGIKRIRRHGVEIALPEFLVGFDFFDGLAAVFDGKFGVEEIPFHADASGPGGTRDIGICSPANGGVQGKELAEAVGLALVPIGSIGGDGGVGAGLDDAAHDHFEIDTTATGGAIVGEQFRAGGANGVDHLVEVFDIPDFGDALAIGWIIGAPEAERIHIEIIAVLVDAGGIHLGDDEMGKPFGGGGIAEVKEAAVDLGLAGGKDKLGMFAGDFGIGSNAFGFVPHEKAQAELVTGVADGFKAAGKLLGLNRPVTHTAGKITFEPARVEPVGIAAELFFDFGSSDLAGFSGPFTTASCEKDDVERLGGDSEFGKIAVDVRDVVGKEQPAEFVVRVNVVAAGGHEKDAWGTDGFTGMQSKVRKLHAGSEVETLGVAGNAGGPLAGPSDGYEQVFRAIFNGEEGKSAIARPTAAGREGNSLVRQDRTGDGGEAVG